MAYPTLAFRRRHLLAASAAVSALLAAQPALAQNATTPETVVVTGSRIPVLNATSASPISTATSEQIQLTSAFNAEDVLTKLVGPDTTGGISNASNNGANGLSELGLRNLGPTRTLILIDGQRLVPIFSSSISVPDLNSIPISMIDRVEVLRDGASSIYGADAIGGVINFITKKDFQGLQFDANFGASEHGGGDLYSITGTMGFNFDKGNVTISLLNEHQSPVDMKDRDWSIDPHIGQGSLEGGSTFRSQLNILQDTQSNTAWNGTETSINDPSLGSIPCLTFLPHAGRVKLNAGCPSVVPNATLTSGIGRTQAAWNAHYDIMPDVTFVASGFFTRRDSEQRLRPEPLLGDQIAAANPITGGIVYGGFMVPTSFPGYNDPLGIAATTTCPDPTGAQTGLGLAPTCIDANLTPNNFGPRDYKQVSNTYRVRVGFEGHVFSDFNWEAGYVQQRNDSQLRILNSGNFLHLAQATAQLPCLDVPGGCTFNPLFGYNTPTTPINFFNGVNTLTPDQVKYLTTTLTETQYTYENYMYADINGPLFDLPAGPLQASVGFERRFEYANDAPDALVQEGYGAGPSAPTGGGYGVTSFYGEMRIPVLKDLPFAEFLTITPSGRFDHYSTFGDALTWKVGGEWQIIDDIRMRGSYSTGLRAPSTAELFGGHAISYISVDGDPCDSRAAGFNGNTNAGLGSLAPGSACFTQLAARGLTPAQIATYQSPENNLSADQRGLIVGGNPQLKPESSRSWNMGAVITPTFLPGLTLNGDYYEIKIANSILDGGIANNAGPDVVVLGCYVDQNPAYCSQITRSSGGIFQIGSLNTNLGINQVRGMDLEATYNTDVAGLDLPVPGSFLIDLQAEREFLNTTQNPDFSTNEFVGFFNYGNDSIQPTWRSTASVDYHLDDLGFHYGLRYINGTKNLQGGTNTYGNRLPEVFYSDIAVSYDLPEIGPSKSTRLVLGINNLFDKSPPFLTGDSIGKSNTIAGPYDVTGRFFFARISTKF
jgi:iron complex outermembrane recepter protein